MGFVATAKWLVFTVQGDEQLITNDLGYSPFINPISKEQGMAIPLAHDRVLGVIPTIVHHPVLIKSNGKWTPIISYIDLPPNNHQGLNKSLAKNGLRFIFGSDKAIIKKYIQGSIPVSNSPEPVELGFPYGRFSRAHEFTWHRLIGAINRSPSDKAHGTSP
ncbi:MAG TPA: hypothetical protein VLA72_10195 [Anaerolineales bacterium]|nr:hypothetical protein [Anaerolineales bacterium]